jgi:hypothetical protein
MSSGEQREFQSRVSRRRRMRRIRIRSGLILLALTAGVLEGAIVPAAEAQNTPAATLDLKGLEQRLRDTHAIGLFTKLSLKNQVDDLLAQFRAFHQGDSGITLAQLRQQYELLLFKVVSLLQDDDPELASTVSSSRQAIWNLLVNPKTFANI